MEKWFERKFDTLNPNLSFPGVLERLKGTPWRLEGILGAIPPEVFIDPAAQHMVDPGKRRSSVYA